MKTEAEPCRDLSSRSNDNGRTKKTVCLEDDVLIGSLVVVNREDSVYRYHSIDRNYRIVRE